MEQIHKEIRAARRIYLGLILVAALAMAILFYLIVHQQHEITKQTRAIQIQRQQQIFRNCLSQNSRHDKAIKILNKLLSVPGVPAGRRRSTRAFTVPLINVLEPHRNCSLTASDAVGKT